MEDHEKVALITGSSRGVGKELSKAFAKQGYKVVINFINNKEKAEQVKDQIVAMGGEATVFRADVGNEQDVIEMMRYIHNQYGRLDVLVNNAGIFQDSVIWKMESDAWKNVLETNLNGVFNCTKHASVIMREQRFGRIITITSVVGQIGGFGVSNYAASKAGVIGLTKGVARELAGRNITVNAVALGFIDTGMLHALNDEMRAHIIKEIPQGRWGKPEEVASTVLFLASDGAGYITGQTINVNGGYYM